jgi:two-component system phosphate regulon sensor histidine kinase PhoR
VRALQGAGLWLAVDASLRVHDASAMARDFLGRPTLPGSLVTVTRSAAAEAAARRAVQGEPGPWDFEATHFRRILRMRAAPVSADWTILYLEDITELRRLEAMRADFVANLAHELRTPVASLSLAAETLSSGLPPAEQQRFVQRIAEETRYIEGLLRTVSELALLEGAVSLAVGEFALHEVVEESWRRVVDRQGEALLKNAVPRDLLVRADRVRLSEVLQNLLENAHRFNPTGQPVTVIAREVDESIEVAVEDRGPGIPPDDLPRVFERFYKVDRARTRRGDGSGLGLAISKHLISAHGGTIRAEAGEGSGTRVVFALPRRIELDLTQI